MLKPKTIMSKFILRGNKVLIDKPEKKEEDNKLDLILSKDDEKGIEEDMMKEWTHLNVFAVGVDVTDVNEGGIKYMLELVLYIMLRS